MVDLKELSEILQKGDAEKVGELTTQALEDGFSPHQVLSEGLIAGMDVVGMKFKEGELFLPEVLSVARAMHAGLNVLRPKLAETGAKLVGKVVLGTVKGDLHDIGKNLVGMMLEGAGFDVKDLGIDVPPEKFVDAAREPDVDIVGMSALLSTTMPKMRETINVLHEAGLTPGIKVMVGGAPVTRKYAEEIGADGYGDNAASAVDVARRLVGKSSTISWRKEK
ncbi:MAG: corrinoid protein [Candidatus Hydrogenedentota bacterium]|nr:MAG: corrinoid protein [Candidatus Hydrogenedentota bacterium]